MKQKPPEAAPKLPDPAAPETERVPFGQVLRRLVDAKAKKPAPKTSKPPRKL